MSLSYFIISTQNNYFVIMFTMVIFGFGMGVNMPNMTLWIINVTKPLNRGLVIGGMFSAIYSGKFLSSILITQMGKIATPHTTYFMAACLMITVSLAIAAFSGKKKNY